VNVVLVHNVTSSFFTTKIEFCYTRMFNGCVQVKPESLQVTNQVRTFHIRLPKSKVKIL